MVWGCCHVAGRPIFKALRVGDGDGGVVVVVEDASVGGAAGVGPQGLRATAATAVARIAAVLVWRATGGAGVPAPAFQWGLRVEFPPGGLRGGLLDVRRGAVGWEGADLGRAVTVCGPVQKAELG